MAKAKSLAEKMAEEETPNHYSDRRFEDQFDDKTKAELAELKRAFNAGEYPGWSQQNLRDWLLDNEKSGLEIRTLSKTTVNAWLRRAD